MERNILPDNRNTA